MIPMDKLPAHGFTEQAGPLSVNQGEAFRVFATASNPQPEPPRPASPPVALAPEATT